MNEKNYNSDGKGKRTIVFVHYFGGDAGSWRWLVKRLTPKHRCIVLNLPGFGGTTPINEPSIYEFATYINTCIAKLELDNYIICGHSMGAKLVLYAAQLMAENKPKHIILIAPSPPTTEQMDASEKKRMMHHPDRDEAIATVEGATLKKLRPDRFEYAIESQLQIDSNTWNWWLNTGMAHSIADRITGLEMGTTVIYSKDDPVIPEENIHTEVLPYLNKPSIVALSKIGHLIPMEAPRKLAREIKRISKSVFAETKD